jgi:hypothetical protein
MLRSRRRDTWENDGEVRKYASPSEITAYFRENRDPLFWMALVITGREGLAESSLTVACNDSSHRRSVFLSSVGLWAQFAVVRSATASIKEDIADAAIMYQGKSCEHDGHPGLCEAEIRVLRAIEPSVVFTDLDPLARSVLILQTLRNTTLYDCVLALDLPRATVMAAYCRALLWLHARQSSDAATSNSPVQIS